MIEQKSCPFCGAREILEFRKVCEMFSGVDIDQEWIICPTSEGGCGVTSMFASNRRFLIEAWNARA